MGDGSPKTWTAKIADVTVTFGVGKFVLCHSDATTERALDAADRIEAIFGDAANGGDLSFSDISGADLALLVQHVRHVGADSELRRAYSARLLADRISAAEAEVQRLKG
jgi:hypothetical protein